MKRRPRNSPFCKENASAHRRWQRQVDLLGSALYVRLCVSLHAKMGMAERWVILGPVQAALTPKASPALGRHHLC
jgi:hypothetical protein